MPYIARLGSYSRFVRDEDADALRQQGYALTYVDPSQTTTGPNGEVMISFEALQQQQAFANSLQLAQAMRALEQNQTAQYGAVTGRIGQAVNLLGTPENYGKLANVTAGDARAPGLAVVSDLARLAGPSAEQPDYASLKTRSAKDVSDFFRAADEMTSAEREAAGGKRGATQPTGEVQPDAGVGGAGAKTAVGETPPVNTQQWGPPDAQGRTPITGVYSPTTRQLRLSYEDGSNRVYGPNDAVTYDFESHLGDPAFASQFQTNAVGIPGGTAPQQAAATAPAAAASPTASPSAAAAKAPLFQTTAGPATVAMGDQRTWTPVENTGPMLAGRTDRLGRPIADTSQYERLPDLRTNEGDTSDIAWKRKSHALIASHGYGHGSDARNAAHRAAGMTGEQFDRIVKHGGDPFKQRRAAAGGTFGGEMPKPAMFGPDAAGAAPAPEGLPFDPHDPSTLGPEQMQEIAQILQSPPSPSPSALEAAVRECWSLGPDGAPIYTGHYADNAARGTATLPDGGMPMATPSDGMTPMTASPAAPMDMPPAVGGKPALFAEGGTAGVDRRTQPLPPAYGLTGPPQGVGASVYANPYSSNPISVVVGARHGEYATGTDAAGNTRALNPDINRTAAPTATRPPASVSTVGPRPSTSGGGAAGTARTAASARRPAGERSPGGGGAAAPAGPSADEMRKVTNYYVAQFGGTPEDATRDLQSADAGAWLRSALGMARAGQLDAYDVAPPPTAPVQAQSAAPAAPVDLTASVPGVTDTAWARGVLGAPPAAAATPPSDYAGAVMGGVGNGLRLSGGRVTTAATPSPVPPHPEEVKQAIAGMTYEDAVSYINEMFGRSGWGPATPPDGVARRAMGGTTFVARKPTLFAAGGQDFFVGEDTTHGHPSGADELVSVLDRDGQTVVHVDPLQRAGTGIPPAVAASANLAVPGSPYAAKAGPPASATHPGRMAAGGTVRPPGGNQGAYGPMVRYARDPIPTTRYVPEYITSPGPHGVEYPIGRGGQAMPTFVADPLGADMVHYPMPGVSRNAAGGTHVYGGPISAGARVVRVGGPPSATGQVEMPGGRSRKKVRVPFYMAGPIPTPENALSRDVDVMDPQRVYALNQYTTNRLGFDVNQWQALQQKARPWWQAPPQYGTYSNRF